ncbi:calcium/sodium antiporter [Alteromonas sp. ASW11-36]|uniref:Calcium/sodium antiporter n=1 Tax=Alteromonas arenosi TaxID=3055817 RepID=A0ABT7STC4_9ALTE|nr:calcium/sodium antiporter [Alteromonas sp. ASW11-36]MDM7859450.1 calcium/sodium antiporter [Alteromonas sp. ASW11-36]
MFIHVAIFVLGVIVLSWSADRFVYGASAIAKNSGVSPLLIGLTIVAMGSSAPEIVVAAIASFAGNPDTAVGNAIGSNITNIGLVLGITALMRPVIVRSLTVKREMPILLLICLLAAWFISDQVISFVEGVVLIIGFGLILFGMGYLALTTRKDDPMQRETEDEIPKNVSDLSAWLWIVTGLVLLPASAHFIIESATHIAIYLGVSQLVIGLTVIALGTSLPELAASIAGVLKGEHDLAMGNIVGSNIFNLLAVLAMPGLIAPGVIDQEAATRDIYVMLGFTILLLVYSFDVLGRRRINRLEAFSLLIAFGVYQWFLFG